MCVIKGLEQHTREMVQGRLGNTHCHHEVLRYSTWPGNLRPAIMALDSINIHNTIHLPIQNRVEDWVRICKGNIIKYN
jgi:hypothetical protein